MSEEEMKLVSKISKIILSIVTFSLLVSYFPAHTAYADNLKFYNYSTGSYENYTGKQVVYTFNSREIHMNYPGILVNGTALADVEDLFVSELGLNAEKNGENIIISDGVTQMILTIGSKKVLVNGNYETVSVAPVKLKFGDAVKYYVPTRFVAETFGLDYVWVSDISTVRITKTFQLICDENPITYNGTLYTVNYNDSRIYTEMPIINYNGCVMVPAQQIFEALGCGYTEENNSLSISKGELIFQQEIGNKIAYVNGRKVIGYSVPVKIMDSSFEKAATYISLDFVTDMLGFERSYDNDQKCYSLCENNVTGKSSLHGNIPNDILSDENFLFGVEEEPLHRYFEWTAEENNAPEQKFLSGACAYSLENADVVELYGIKREDINDFFDGGFVIFELNDVYTNMDTCFFSDDEAPHLTYAFIAEINGTIKLYFIVPIEDNWTILDTKDGVRVYFYHSDYSEEDLKTYSQSRYPDDKLLIPMDESVDLLSIYDEDVYWENRFSIKIKGNWEEYYKEHQIINPYYGISVSKIRYDIVNNLTIITFDTKYICSYSYSMDNGYLVVTIGKPGEIYSKVVLFDAGHGGIDSGAAKNGVKEKDINFKIINTYVSDLFKDSDIKVYFTRKTDVKVDLYERAALASKIGADMFISLHLNSSSSSATNGTEVYYSKENNQITSLGLNSYQLAKKLAGNLSAELNSKNRGVISSNFVVTKYNTVPAVLIELGYMTNKTELSKLTDEAYQKKAAETIYRTVVSLYDSAY